MQALTYLTADSMFDSINGVFVKNPWILIKGDRIEKVAFGTAAIPAGIPVIDMSGCTLLPGLIDAHNHLSLSPQLNNHPYLMFDPDPVLVMRTITNLTTDLMSGVTSSRCLGEKNFIDFYIKAAINQGSIAGPRLVVAGRGIKASHAHGFVGTPYDGVEAIRMAVRENLRRGADLTKLFVTGNTKSTGFLPYYLSPAEIGIAVQETHQAGKKVAVHCIGGDGLTHCLEQGVDVIEHAYFATDEQIEQLVALNRWVVLTPRIFFNDARWSTVSQQSVAEFQYNREEVVERHQKLIRSGVKFAVGTDASHGEFAEDIILLTKLGNTIESALQAATISAARVSEIDADTGSISAGKYADFVAVSGDLANDIEQLRSICFVMKGGQVCRHTAKGV